MPTVAELKAELKQLGQSVQGNKSDLEKRLAQVKLQQQQSTTTTTTTREASLPPTKRFQQDKTAGGGGERSKCEQFFKTLSKDMESMDAEKTLEFCELLGIDPEQIAALELSYFLNSPSMGTFNQDGFVDGLIKNFKSASSIQELKAHVATLDKRFHMEFSDGYKFVFGWGCEPGIRNMKKEVALSLWKLLIPKTMYASIDDWIKHLEESPARVVTKDEWLSFKRFVDVTKKTPTLVDDDAWPLLIDEFVEKLKKQSKS